MTEQPPASNNPEVDTGKTHSSGTNTTILGHQEITNIYVCHHCFFLRYKKPLIILISER